MTNKITLTGMTWDHSRGYDPMVATSSCYTESHPEVEIIWEKRSLQAFADRPIAEMADQYDLMVIDHPHVGEVSKSGLLLAFDETGREAELDTLAKQSVGPSFESYAFDGKQWALPIDAATPVAAFRSDKIAQAPKHWDEVVELAKLGQVAFALIPINALMVFFGIAKNLGLAVAENPNQLIESDGGRKVLELMREITALMNPKCLSLDPIGVLEWMGRDANGPAYSPFGYGYSNYSRENYCPFPLTFADAPCLADLVDMGNSESNTPRGTVIGGTGIAVSAKSVHQQTAVDYAFWIAGAECQSGLFFDAGGQPANAVAWESQHCNNNSRNFFQNTRATLESSWLRPRYDGYMNFQDKGGNIIHDYLLAKQNTEQTLQALADAYLESQV